MVNEYDQEIPQSQTADNPVAREEEPLNHHVTPGGQIKQSNQLPLPHHKPWLSVSLEPLSLLHHSGLISLDCFSVMRHCIS